METRASRRTLPVTVHLPADLKAELEQAARADNRTLSNLIRKFAESAVRAEQEATAA